MAQVRVRVRANLPARYVIFLFTDGEVHDAADQLRKARPTNKYARPETHVSPTVRVSSRRAASPRLPTAGGILPSPIITVGVERDILFPYARPRWGLLASNDDLLDGSIA